MSVSAAVVDDPGRFLIIQRADNGRWEPPGGVLELRESIEEGLVREVLEETGYEVRPVALTGVYKNLVLGVVALVFRCEPGAHSEPRDHEARAVRWAAPEELPDCMTESYVVRLADAMRSGPPCVRAHDGTRVVTR